jgi:hypothetical protein
MEREDFVPQTKCSQAVLVAEGNEQMKIEEVKRT